MIKNVKKKLFFVLVFLFCSVSYCWGQENTLKTLNCTFSEPVEIGENFWQFSKMECDSDYFFQIQGQTATDTFLILRQFSFADIIQTMLLIFIFALLIFYILKQLTLPQEVKTHSLPREQDF